jgi:hypothetical protein
VNRLGEFLPIGLLLTSNSFVEVTEIFGLFHDKRIFFNFDTKKCIGLHFGRCCEKLI